MITDKQIKTIWVLARQLGIGSDLLHDLVLKCTGKNSIRKLSVTEGKEIIKAFIEEGGKITKKRRAPKDLPCNVVEMVSKEQRWLIKRFEQELGWTDNPERLKGFIARTIKRRQVTTKQDAIKVIQGLKNMVERKARGRANNG